MPVNNEPAPTIELNNIPINTNYDRFSPFVFEDVIGFNRCSCFDNYFEIEQTAIDADDIESLVNFSAGSCSNDRPSCD